MIVTVSATPYGAYIISAKSEKIRRRIKKHLNGYNIVGHTAFVQGDWELPDWVRPKHRKMLDKGYDVNIRVDAWEALHMWGWDTYTIAEGRK